MNYQDAKKIINAKSWKGLDGPHAALCVSGCVIAACALFLVAHLSSYPIELWDESRSAVNAIEMYQSGTSLVTTYEFHPDLWNTKPPLLIWLMAWSMRLFGPSEWALRLPSAAAAVATLAVVMGFTWRLTRSIPTTVLACMLLFASPGFFGYHAAATGDYDALLCFFTTAYVCLLFFILHRRRPKPWRILIAGALVAAAVLTKGVAGLLPGVGIAVYLVATRRWSRPFLSPWYLVSGIAVVLVAVSFFGLRELAGRGYLAAVMSNDLGGRYFRTIGKHSGALWYYVFRAGGFKFSAGPLVFLAPFGLIVASRSRVRLGLLYSLCIVVGLLITLSLGATKLPWYLIPAYPFQAISLAIATQLFIRKAAKEARWSSLRVRAIQIGVLVLAFFLALSWRVIIFQHDYHRDEPQAKYDALFESLSRQGIHDVTIVDAGVSNTEGLVNYSPQLRFYALLWSAKKLKVHDILPDLTTLPNHTGAVIATCDPRWGDTVSRLGHEIGAVSGCVAVFYQER
jgi:4-amino-4-deoxy-L-arabinose transferase-like glycosyltransferase